MPSNPNPTYYKRNQINARTWSFSFDSIADYDKFIEDKIRTATSSAKRTLDGYTDGSLVTMNIRANGGNNWYGTNNPSEVQQNLDTFLYRNDLQRILSNLTNSLNKVSLADIDQQKSIKFTEQEIGIFSFDLASLGLIAVYEYFSPLTNGIVDPNLVEGVKNAEGETIFFFKGQPFVPKHKIEYNINTGGFFSPILKKNIPKSELTLVDNGVDIYYEFPEMKEIPRHSVLRKQMLNEDGSKKFATTFKKCFVHIPKVEKPLPRIDIIVPFSFNLTFSADSMKYNSVAAIALAEALSKIGVNYRIVATYPIQQGSSRKIFQYINIKKETEALDKNKMALFIGDARYYRYQRFRGVNAALSDIDSDANGGDGNWTTITDTDEIKRNYVDFLALQTNPEDVEASKRLNSKIVLNIASSEQAALQEYQRVIRLIENL